MNKEHGVGPAEDKLVEAIAAMKAMPVSPMPQELLPVSESDGPQRILAPRWVVQFVLAASVALVVGGFLWMQSTDSATAFAQVLEEVERTKSFRAKVTDGPRTVMMYQLEDRTRFVEMDGSSETLCLPTDNVTIQVDHHQKMVKRTTNEPDRLSMDVRRIFRELASAAVKSGEEYTAPSGKQYRGLTGRTTIGVNKTPVEVDVWFDPDVNLPVRMQLRIEGAENPVLLEELQFDQPVYSEQFQYKVPPGYREYQHPPLKQPLTAEEAERIVLKPGQGIGEVKFGMNRAEVIAILGEPESSMTSEYILDYPSWGLQLQLVGHQQLGMLGIIKANSKSQHRNPFPGQTEEGIKIGSTREEIIAAYGQPEKSIDSEQSASYLSYPWKGLTFRLLEGKLDDITVARTP